MNKKRSKDRIKRLIAGVLILGSLIAVFIPLYMYFSVDVSALANQYPHLKIKNQRVESLEIQKKRPGYWSPLNQISSYGKWAIILSEDWAFYQHQGVDTEQMKVALEEMVSEFRFRGASTITQQMVKNVFLSDARSLWRKTHELILTHKVESHLSKSRILEIYLNSIEYGPGIYGIRNASKHYFRKDPAYLNPREAAFLAMLLPSPKRYYESFRKKSLTPFARKRVKAILQKMKMAKVITSDQYSDYLYSQFFWER